MRAHVVGLPEPVIDDDLCLFGGGEPLCACFQTRTDRAPVNQRELHRKPAPQWLDAQQGVHDRCLFPDQGFSIGLASWRGLVLGYVSGC